MLRAKREGGRAARVNPAVAALAAVVAGNYLRHRRGLQTICAWVREHVPEPIAAALLDAGFAWLRPHLLNGYPAHQTKETS